MKILLFSPDEPDLTMLCQWNVITLEVTSSNICENEEVGLSPSGDTHYLNLVLKIYLVAFEQGAWHEGMGPALSFSHGF